MKTTFEIKNDVLYKYIPMPEISKDTYRKEVVMTKEAFLQCYKQWVLEEQIEEEEEN